LKYDEEEKQFVLLHSVVLNESEDAFCTPPESITIQHGKHLYYFKIEKDDHECNGLNSLAHLKRFDLSTQTEDDDSLEVFTLQNTEIDNPMYI
jgi:hypothetical protein